MNSLEKYRAQSAINHFCPGMICTSCHQNMFEHKNITDTIAKENVMTACPWCNRSWLD